MKKIILLVIVFTSVFALSACTGTPDNNEVETLSSEQSLATLSYVSAGFLDVSTTSPSANNVLFLTSDTETEEETEEETVIEEEIEEVNIYMDKLKGFIDNGVESFGSVNEVESDNELYEFKITFTVNEVDYSIYYNIDAETEELTGVILFGEIEYDFEVVDNIKRYELHEEKHQRNDDEVDQEDEAEETEDEAEENEENEEKMVLIARSGEDFIKVVYKSETEEDETSTKFLMEKFIDGVTSNVELKISIEEDEYKVRVTEDGNTYTFKSEVDEEGTVYRLEYNVDGTRGFVMIHVSLDENGEEVYEYKIQEAGRNKTITRGKPERSGSKNQGKNQQGQQNSGSTL